MNKAYTLIELLVSLMIFSILALITSTALINSFNTNKLISAHLQKLRSIQTTIHLLRSSLQNIIVRKNSIFSQFNGKLNHLEFNRNKVHNTYTNIKHLAFICNNKKLILKTWPSINLVEPGNSKQTVVLKDLTTDCSFRYFMNNKTISTNANSLPLAVELNLNLKSWGRAQLLFPVGAIF